MARRGWGTGSVFHDRTTGKWVARISLGVVDGKRVQHKLTAPTKKAAEAKLDRLQRTYGAGGDAALMSLDEYLYGWLETHRQSIAESTAVSYEGHIRKHVSPFLGGIRVIDLRPDDVRRLITQLRKDRSASTVIRIVTTLRIALGQAYRDRAIPDNPAAGIRLPRVDREPVRALTAADVGAIVDAVKGDEFENLYLLLLGSGLRLGEACALDWRDVGEGVVTVRRSKGKRARSVGITAYAAEALAKQRAQAKRYGPNEPVFLGPRTGERLQPGTASHAFPRLLERTGLPRMRVHDLRHGHATRMLAYGVPMRTIADQLGHANPALTARVYAHVVPEALREAVDRLDADIGSRDESRTG